MIMSQILGIGDEGGEDEQEDLHAIDEEENEFDQKEERSCHTCTDLDDLQSDYDPEIENEENPQIDEEQI